MNWTCCVKQLSLHEWWTVQWSGQSPILGLGLPHLWSACTLNLIFTLSWNNSTESQLYCILVHSQLNIYFELKAFYWILAILYICILVYSQLNIYWEFDSRYIVYMYTLNLIFTLNPARYCIESATSLLSGAEWLGINDSSAAWWRRWELNSSVNGTRGREDGDSDLIFYSAHCKVWSRTFPVSMIAALAGLSMKKTGVE